MESTEQATPLALQEAAQIDDSRNPVFRLLIILGAMLLIILPFVTTFNEFLTRLVEILGLDAILTDWVVPFEARCIAVLLKLLGIHTWVSPTTIYLDKGGLLLPLYISWNCVGWQSFILYAATLITGLQGPFTRSSKIEASLVGLLGTYLVNLLRITSVAVVAYHFGSLPAVIYHDYGGTIIILLWLFFFWWVSHGWLLEPLEKLPDTPIEERFLKEIYGPSEAEATQHPRTFKAAWKRLGRWMTRWVPWRRSRGHPVKPAKGSGQPMSSSSTDDGDGRRPGS
ncbi:MAG: exosortase/archaeosortase family protein [Anaerolineales bacterium]|jgi:exosortase/archaeosortase family protein